MRGVIMENEQIPPTTSEKLHGIISLLVMSEVKCDKCGKVLRDQERYCCNTHECPMCDAIFDTTTKLDSHFDQQHPPEPSRGTRYCIDCSLKAGYLKMIRDKKTSEVFPAMFVLRDEETVSDLGEST